MNYGKSNYFLQRDLLYYLEHQDDLVKNYDGKFLAIKDRVVLGAFDTNREAVEETSKTHEPGSFLIKKCTNED